MASSLACSSSLTREAGGSSAPISTAKPRKSSAAATPHLADDPAVGERYSPGQPLKLHQRHDITVPAFNGDERARVQDKHQAAPQP